MEEAERNSEEMISLLCILTCSMVTEVITWRMDQGVTTMMKVKEIADRLLIRLAVFSASWLSFMGLFAMVDQMSEGRAEKKCLSVLYF